MANLNEALAAPAKRKPVIADCVQMIDDEVASKGGLTGLAIKGAYKLVKNFKPGFVPDVVDALLEDFCSKLQPVVDEAQAKGQPVRAYFDANRARVADALLGITDDRAARSKHGAIKGAYEKLRPMAKKNVEEAAPRVGGLIEKHLE